MPKITIKEVDYSTPGNAEITSNAVYIPGLMGTFTDPKITKVVDTSKIVRYDTVSAFKKDIGDQPYVFEDAVAYNEILKISDLDTIKNTYTTPVLDPTTGKPTIGEDGEPVTTVGIEYTEALDYLGLLSTSTTSPNFINKNDVDKSYVMAVELLSQGIPVYYQIIVNTSNSVTEADVTNQVNQKVKEYLIASGTEEDDITSEMINNYPERPKMLSDALAKANASSIVIPEGSTKSAAVVNSIYNTLGNMFDNETSPLSDMGTYVLKFVTSGGYPTFNKNGLATRMCEFAKNRTDLVSLIDYFPYYEKLEGGTDTLFEVVSNWNNVSTVSGAESDLYTYGSMFTPYAIYEPTSINLSAVRTIDENGIEQDGASSTITMPASFGYLMAFATAVKSYPTYYAVAGVARGSIPHFSAFQTIISNKQADEYQPRNGKTSINAITTVQPYGVKIWGNRTLKNNTGNGELVATSFLNIRILANEVKRYLYAAARRYTFEQNSDVLWINFKSMLVPQLEAMIQNNGITGYRFVRLKTTKKATLKAKIILECVEAVEDFELEVALVDAVLDIEEGV